MNALAKMLLTALLPAVGLLAAEFDGTVQANGLPVPGAAVTAIQGAQKIATSTDEKGAFSFRELGTGKWTIAVEMLGFAKSVHEVNVAAATPAAKWELKILNQQALLAALHPAAINPDAAPASRPTPRGKRWKPLTG